MRALYALGAGALLAASIWAVAMTGDGMLQAGAFLLALFVATITLGFAVAWIVERAPAARLRRWGHHVVRPGVNRCSACHSPLAEVGEMLVCRACDRVAVES